jgi:hypothetical protein
MPAGKALPVVAGDSKIASSIARTLVETAKGPRFHPWQPRIL